MKTENDKVTIDEDTAEVTVKLSDLIVLDGVISLISGGLHESGISDGQAFEETERASDIIAYLLSGVKTTIE